MERDAPAVGSPAERSASRAATWATSARFAVSAAPVAAWAALSLLRGAPWHPGSTLWVWVLVGLCVVACFAAAQELDAISRHRRCDAAAAGSVPALTVAALPAPRGADAQLNLDGRRVVVVVVDAADATVRHRSVLAGSGVRRGVSAARLRAAARRAGADPAVLVASCGERSCVGRHRTGDVEVLCVAALTASTSQR